MLLARRMAVATATGIWMVALSTAAIAATGDARGLTATGPAAAAQPVVQPPLLDRVMREGTTPLPTPLDSGAVSVETALARRRSVREFAERPLTAAEISQLLWAAQGVTSTDGRRTAPSAGALYPLEIYVATAEGVGHHLPAGHLLEPRLSGDLRSRLSRAALSQPSVSAAPAIFIITGVAERTRVKYGDRAERYIWLEAGHAAQNLLLQATALGLAGVPIGAFSDEALRRELNLPNGEMPLYLVPIGAPR